MRQHQDKLPICYNTNNKNTALPNLNLNHKGNADVWQDLNPDAKEQKH